MLYEVITLYNAAKDGMFADISSMLKNSTVYSKYYEDGFLPADTYSNSYNFV